MNSPFNRSGLTPRTPPPQPRDEAIPESAPQPALVSTPDLQNWMNSIEACLSEVCAVAAESKLNSDQKQKIQGLCRKITNGTSNLVVLYQSVKQKCIAAHMTIQHLNEKQELASQLKDLKTSVQDVCNQSAPEKASYANVIKASNKLIRPTNLSSLAVFPTDKEKSSEDTRNLVQQIIKPKDLNLQVRGMRKTKNGGVIISTASEEDIKKLKASDKFTTSGLSISDPIKRKPRVIIYGLPKDLAEEEFFEQMYVQNIAPKFPQMSREAFLGATKLSHKSGKKDSQSCNFVLEVMPTIRKALINQERVFLNWSSYSIKDFTLVSRCFNCQQYGHSAKFCREKEPTCGHCGQVGHAMKDCTKKEAASVCATCQRYKKPSAHKTGDEHCPARVHAVTSYINSTDYEGA